MKTVCVVDDERSIREALTFLLIEEGYNVKAYSRGSALLQMETELPDAILLDMYLSGEDGRDIVRGLKKKQETKHIPVIMISAFPHALHTVKECGADAFLAKPFDMAELLSILGRYNLS